MFQVAQADGVKPEHVVQSVVQAGGDEQTVQESIDTCADAVQTGNAVAQSNQNAEDNGPDEQQDDGNHDGNQGGHDSNAALAAEECQPVRQLGALELVVAGGADDSSQDADEGVAGDLAESNVINGALFQGGTNSSADGAHNTGAEQLLHHQKADQTSQTGGAVMVVCQADSCADGEQPSHVIDQSAASLDQQEADRVSSTGSRTFSTHNGGSQSVANTHQNTTDGQRGNGQHQCLAELLQPFHHKIHSS